MHRLPGPSGKHAGQQAVAWLHMLLTMHATQQAGRPAGRAGRAWEGLTQLETLLTLRQVQDAGLLVSRRAHGAHHRAPFEGNYCIVSGIWNDPLDKSGFFRRLETWIAARTGVEPRCWHEPKYSWQEC